MRLILALVAFHKKNTLKNSFFKKNARKYICINEKLIYLYYVNRWRPFYAFNEMQKNNAAGRA
jgi:hypothetical protein